jgi:hypothetical protein
MASEAYRSTGRAVWKAAAPNQRGSDDRALAARPDFIFFVITGAGLMFLISPDG